MGFYAAPLFDSVDSSLQSGYTPPAGNALSATLLSAGPYAYAPSSFDAIDAELVSGYTAPAGNALSVTLLRPLAGSGMPVDPDGWASSSTGTPFVALAIRILGASGVAPTLAFGSAAIRNGSEIVSLNNEMPRLEHVLEPGYVVDPRYLFATLRQYNDHFRAGYATVEFKNRALSPVWETQATYGLPYIYNLTSGFAPSSFGGATFGTLSIISTTRSLLAAGIAPPSQTEFVNGNRQLPNPMIDFRIRTLVVGPGPSPPFIFAPLLTRDIQFIDQAGWGWDSSRYGTTKLEFRNRTIEVPFIASMVFGGATVKRIVYVEPSGWDSAFISENAELVINTRILYPDSGAGDPAGYGTAAFFNYDTLVNPLGFLSQNISFPVLYNLKQQITVRPFEDNLPPDRWPNFSPLVENKTRYLRTFGHQSSRFAFTNWIRNNAAPAKPAGLDATLWGAETFIAHRIRTVFGQGWDSYYSTVFTVVYNTADVLRPQSWVSSNVGKPSQVLNINREVKQHSGWVGAIWGTPFVAYGVRTIAPNVFYDVPASFPEVRHNPFPIVPVGIPWQGQVGGHEVRIFKREVFPFSLNVTQFPRIGVAEVRNRNITVFPYAYEQTTFGVQDIQNFIRYVAPVWTNPEYFGRPLIDRRTKNANPASVTPPVFTVLHRIRNVLPDPPSVQRILLDRYDTSGNPTDGNGIPPPSIQVPFPQANLRTLFPEGIADTRYGTAKVYSTTIETFVFGSDVVFGIPTLIFTRYVQPAGFWASFQQVPAGIRMTPWNIYAPAGDARPPNYNPGGGEPIDYWLSSFDASARPWFGHTTIANKHRAIGPVPTRFAGFDNFDSYPRYGQPSVHNARQYVFPDGIRSLRMGFPLIPFVPQDIVLGSDLIHYGIAPSTIWGANKIAFPPPAPDADQFIGASGGVLTLWGSARVELLHRTVVASGIPHAGGSSGTNPWGLALVGFPRRYTIGMGVQSLWGTHVIEYKNRQVFPTGFLSCTLEVFNFEDFKFPMRVRLINPLVRPASVPSTQAIGSHDVSHGERTVYGRGIDGYNSGLHKVAATTTIQVSGWDSSEYGDIDRWEAGKIKAHGDDLSTMGYPRILNPLRPQGWEEFMSGAHRMANGLGAQGIVPPAVDGPSVTNPFGCTNRVTTPLPVLSTQVVSIPTIGAI